MAALPQAEGGDYKTLSAYNQRALSRDPSLAARYGVTNYPSSGVSASSSKSSSNDAVDFAKEYAVGLQKLIDQQNARQDALFAKYTELSGSQEKLGSAYTRMQEEAGVPDLNAQLQIYKDEIFKTKALIDKLDEDVKTRTTGSFTNEAQVNRQIAAEGEPLTKNLARLGTAEAPILDRLSSASSSIATQLGLLQADQSKELQPLTMQINSLSDRFAREITGYTTGQQAQLSAIIDKINRDQQVTDQEWARANELADQETAWSREKEKLQLQFEYDMKSKKASGDGSSSTNFSQAQVDQGNEILASRDKSTNIEDTGDKKLSKAEKEGALADMAAYLGDVDKARLLLNKIWISGGYSDWTG